MIFLNTQTAQNNLFGISFVLKLIFCHAIVISNKKISLAWVLYFQAENLVLVQVCYVNLGFTDCRTKRSLKLRSKRGILQVNELCHHDTFFTISFINNLVCVYGKRLKVFSDFSLNLSHTCPYIRPHLFAFSLALSNQHLFHRTNFIFLRSIKKLLKSLILLPELSN